MAQMRISQGPCKGCAVGSIGTTATGSVGTVPCLCFHCGAAPHISRPGPELLNQLRSG